MPAAKRLAKGVLVLSAFADSEPQRFHLGQMAMRVAYSQGWTPLFPVALCASYMTVEEVGSKLREVTLWWYRRVARIWLCVEDPDAPKFDPLTHDVLLLNEGLMVYPDKGGRGHFSKTRLPVYQFRHRDDGAATDVAPLERADLAHFLSCNITAGLFRGLAPEPS